MWSVSYHAPQTMSESCYVIFGLWNTSLHQYIYNSFIVNTTFNDFRAVNSYNLIYFTSWMNWTHMHPCIWPQEPAGRTLSAWRPYKPLWGWLYQHGGMGCTQYSSNLFLQSLMVKIYFAALQLVTENQQPLLFLVSFLPNTMHIQMHTLPDFLPKKDLSVL